MEREKIKSRYEQDFQDLEKRRRDEAESYVKKIRLIQDENTDEIKSSCLPTTILCLGGRDSTNDVLLVVSCGLCSVVLTKTAKNTPNLHNGAYWYYSPNVEYSLSMGFAPSSKTKQKNADCFDLLNKQRISWQLHVNIGGYRLGPFIDLITKFYNNFKFCLLVIVSNIKHNP